jgi:glycosyltransferase involved in cell wall biosynthesis
MSERPVAILVKRFPKLSETFILNEVLGLEARGRALRIFALAPSSDEIVNAAVKRVRAPVKVLPSAAPGDWACVATRRFSRLAAAVGVAFAEFGARDWSAVSQAVALAARMLRCDVGHLHAHFADRPAAIARLAAALAGVPFSISAHAKDIYLQQPARLAHRLRAARFTVTCTGHNAQHLRTLAPEAHVVRAYHGVDLTHLPEGRIGAAPLIVSVGRLRAKKGFDVLIEACRKLARERQDFTCVIAGYGPEQEALRRLIDAADLGGQVTLTGKLPHDEIIALMRAARVFALPCRVLEDGDRDGIPNVLLEAMAVETPVVSTRVSGVPELVADGENGLLVDADNADALAQAIRRLLTDDALARRLGAEGRRTVKARFSLDGDIARLDEMLCASLRGETPAPAAAYILKGFPRLSESFISNEIRILEGMGLPLEIYAIKPGDDLGRAALSEIVAPINYLPAMTPISGVRLDLWLLRNLRAYLGCCAALAFGAPRAFFSTAGRAIGLARTHRDRSSGAWRKVFIKEFLQAAFIAARIRQRRRTRHLHGHFCHGAATVTQFVSELTGVPYSFTAHAKDIYEAKHNPGDLLQRKISRARFSVTCTEANRAHLLERGCDCGGLHTIYHGLDTALFSPRSPQVGREGAPLILSVGRFVEKKGFLDLIEACAILRQRGVAFRCRIVGEEGDASAAMRALIACEELADCVILAPPAPQRALRDIYAEAAVFALPCRITASGDRDGIPNVLAEAMAMELPVVTTGVSGILELVSDGETGLVVRPGDPAALAAALEQLLLAPAARRAQLGRAARAVIVERFDSQKTTSALKLLLAEAIAANEGAE